MLPNPYLTVIGADPRRLLHAIRFDNANWTPTGNVEDQAGNPGFITSVATAADGAVLHLFVAAGSVFHAIRNADGTWTRFENVASRSGDGWFGTLQVAAAVVNGDIQLCGVAQEGRLIHAVHSAGAWSPPIDVFTQAGGPASTFLHVACATHNGELFVAAAPLGFNGILYTTRHDDGTWDPMNALVELSPDPTGQMLRVACASVLRDIHVVSVEAGGRLRHILLDPAAGGTSVSDFLDIKSITGNPGVVAGVAAANCANELHVMLTTNAPDNWRHSIRRANGTWQPFGDVWGATDGARGAQFSAIACAGLQPPETAPIRTTVPALAFELAPCLPADEEAAAIGGLSVALQRIGNVGATVAGLLGGAQVDLACVDGFERGAVFVYSESQQARDNSVLAVDLFSRTEQGTAFDFSILFGAGAIAAAVAAVWDTMRQDDGRVTLPGRPDIELLSYSVDFPPRQLRLNVDGQAQLPGGFPVGFTAHYTDSFEIADVTLGPDGSASSPHHVVSPVDSPSLDISPVFDLIAVFLIPGIINAIIGGLVVSYPAPSVPGLPNGLAGVITQAFLPKLYLPGKRKLLMQYEGVVTGAGFGVQAYGSFEQRERTPVLNVSAAFGHGPINTIRPVGGGDPPPTELIVLATTDDMRDPAISFTTGGLRLLKKSGPQSSADGTQFTSMAIFTVPRKKVTIAVTATDADNLTLSESVTVAAPPID